VDESMDKESLKLPPQSWEFRSKPAWQRLIIMLGGVTVNILLAFVIYAGILMTWGEKKIPASSLKYGLTFNDSLFNDLGFKNGDKVLAVDGKPVVEYTDILKKILVVNKDVTVERDGKETILNMPVDLIGKLVEKKKLADGPLISPRIPVIISMLDDTSVAYNAGLRRGDLILGIDTVQTKYYDEFSAFMKKQKKGDTVSLTVKRNNETLNITTVLINGGKIGFNPPGSHEEYDSLGIYKYEVKKYGFFAAFPAGVKRAGKELQFYIDQFKKILSPSTGAYKGVGGFKAMGSVFSGNEWDWEHFWTITAFFSIVLAFMNLLPIPALDGGHVLFTLGEMITGRKPSEKFLEYAQIVGMVILLALMLYANGNDWFGWGKGK
jgi:regulator of sigma E protease